MDERRGRSGPLHVRTVRRPHGVTAAFVAAAQACGHPFNADYNGESQEGIAYAQLSQLRGMRCSAADAFLKPLLGRGTCREVTQVMKLNHLKVDWSASGGTGMERVQVAFSPPPITSEVAD